jgi:multidrug efflux system outer membrane protein
MKARLPLFILIANLLVAGCTVGPDYVRPPINLPTNHRTTHPAQAENNIAPQHWNTVFTDPALQALIMEALGAGPDALLGAARVREAEALAGVSRSPLLPQASLSLNTSPTVRQPGERFTASYLGGLGISWEIDLWGRYRRAHEASRADLLANEAALHGLQASLVAGVARYYYKIATLHEVLKITTRSASNQEDVLQLVHRLSKSGIASAAEERQQESALAATQSNIPGLKLQIAESEHALSLLLGRSPGSFAIESVAQLVLPGQIPAGLPSSLLEQRPDIRQAEANLISANARVGEAKALFFPSLSLTALFGGVSTSLSDVTYGSASKVSSLGPNLLQPLFAGGQIYFNKAAAEARLELAVINYRKTILNALGEVSTGLTAYQTSEELLQTQRRRFTAASEALRLAELRFRSGTTNLLEVLDTQRQLFSAETQAAEALLQRRLALINVYLALGGGWQEESIK